MEVDTDYHFNQYNEHNDDVRILISINPCPRVDQNKDWRLLRWENLVVMMERSSNNLINSASIFFKKGCDVMTIKKVENIEIPNLLWLNRMVHKAISELNLKINRRAKAFTDDFSGYIFEFESNQDVIYPWFGFNYNDEEGSKNPFGLMCWLNDSASHQNIYKEWKNKYPFEKDKYHKQIANDQVVIMTLTVKEGKKSKELTDFLSKETKEEQIGVIKEFLEEILKPISPQKN